MHYLRSIKKNVCKKQFERSLKNYALIYPIRHALKITQKKHRERLQRGIANLTLSQLI